MTRATQATPDADLPVGTAIELSVVMPCLDEAETLATCIDKALGCFARLGVAGEVVIADNGSTDGSPEIARAHGARVVAVPVRGYGAALQAGIAAARGEFVVMGDADDSYDFSRLDAFLDELRAGHDLVMGNRFAGGIEPGAMPWLHRYLGNPVLSFVGRLFFGAEVRDFHCGLRGFRRDSIRALDLRTTGMEFASEMVVKAELGELRVTEVPTTLSRDGRSRPPHLRSWYDGWRHLRFLLLFSPRWLFLYPGIVLMAAGLIAMILLEPGARVIGRVGLDVQTLLYAGVAVVLGFQAVVFAVLGKVFADSNNLLPPNKRMSRYAHHLRLENGLVLGTVLLVVGLAGAVVSIAHWGSTDFGALDVRHSMRLVVPSVVALMLGAETILASFFLSLLGLPRR